MSVRMTIENNRVVLKNSKIKQTISTVNIAIRLLGLVVRYTVGIDPTSFCDVQSTSGFMDLGV
jgi:hypothetical protein